ncbi:predicted protein [Sclerotinia sclerotiorum 1980 UF-70]|uniref:Uncharacterized protein n=1 Tax=Sclerotinia sclerotiorum (strain ATCC 18683 / 1980 / Ss-1) TaxID=665079 RepID=A7E6F0_SCLS1|nr:predicted protein [Sclerotinia sclerotiorum 1980 UF-70]EDN91472.1 predicted protein [Sclerotinia sclerotiorum 1980 UF-70]
MSHPFFQSSFHRPPAIIIYGVGGKTSLTDPNCYEPLTWAECVWERKEVWNNDKKIRD